MRKIFFLFTFFCCFKLFAFETIALDEKHRVEFNHLNLKSFEVDDANRSYKSNINNFVNSVHSINAFEINLEKNYLNRFIYLSTSYFYVYNRKTNKPDQYNIRRNLITYGLAFELFNFKLSYQFLGFSFSKLIDILKENQNRPARNTTIQYSYELSEKFDFNIKYISLHYSDYFSDIGKVYSYLNFYSVGLKYKF